MTPLEKRLREIVAATLKIWEATCAETDNRLNLHIAKAAYRAGKKDERARCVAICRQPGTSLSPLESCAERIEKGGRR